jgi:Ca2+/Na+ antiporter
MNEAILAILFWCMIGLSVAIIIYPWRFNSRVSRVLAHLPIVLLVAFIAYESLMPPEMDIRVDLLLLLPVFGMVAICYLVKLALMNKRSRSNQHLEQIAAHEPPPPVPNSVEPVPRTLDSLPAPGSSGGR